MALTLPFLRAHAQMRPEKQTQPHDERSAARGPLDEMYARIDEDLADR
ncbi:hypothetical protein [Amnibacterium setariae]|nr:hypothetical protein [Amnibacterium setariae]